MDRPSTFRRSGIRLAGALTVSGTALWLATRHVRVDELRWALSQATFLWLLPYPVICVALNMLRGEIWRRLLHRRVTSAQAFWAYSVGFAANNVLPFRLGEATRVILLSMRGEIPVVEVAAAAGLERLLDMVVLALMLGVLAPSAAKMPGVAGAAALVVLLTFATFVHLSLLANMRLDVAGVFYTALALSSLLAIVPVTILWFLDRRERENPWPFAAAFLWGGLIATGLALPFNTVFFVLVDTWVKEHQTIAQML